MNTAFLLMAQYNGAPVIPLADVCRDYFSHLSPEKMWLKFTQGQLDLPIIQLDPSSQKSAKGVALTDLARFLDGRIAAAQAEAKSLRG